MLFFGKSFGLSANLRTMCSILGAGKSCEFFDFDWKTQTWNLVFAAGLVLGGLITDEKTLKVNGVPVLKEIPLIKYLFSYKEQISNRKELVFVLTPHIIDLNKKSNIKKAGFSLPSLEDL